MFNIHNYVVKQNVVKLVHTFYFIVVMTCAFISMNIDLNVDMY